MVKEIYCTVGDCNSSADKAHIIERANLPKKYWDNPHFIFYLCRKHHTEQHQTGIETFCSKYGLLGRYRNAQEVKSRLCL